MPPSAHFSSPHFSTEMTKSDMLASILELSDEKSLVDVLRPMLETDDSSKSFLTDVQSHLLKVFYRFHTTSKAEPGEGLIDALADQCEEEDLKMAFDFFDVDSDGFLTRKEMQAGFAALGERDIDIPQSMEVCDFETFKQIMTKDN